ncbi:FAD-binding protein [Falsihalocynthiibacter arcticus]|uniref:2-hydroxy-acid oxidase n=1 Tax=Falsihalocynthiibacter arcticus TaxID=1579316 RepID=A0A126UZ71_9RHOB|nr:FAD-binding protein [Falsihalocynthiibacter arcticus]AML51368.1 2-hydroxy-acid oxidase [Falsihalocynthiibacter arcticus]
MTKPQIDCPRSEKELAEFVRDTQRAVRVTGGDTRKTGSTRAEDMVSTSALSGITLYDPGALTLVAKSGTPLLEIENALAAENQRLAFEPMDHRGLLGTQGVSTIGGVVAANVSGPRRVQVGACRDHLLGVRFVDGRGDVIKNGGRVMKNVTGYDLVKLMAGSYGTLGILSEVSLKVLPQVEAVATVLIKGLTNSEAVSVMSRAMGSPYEVSGAAHMPLGMEGEAATTLRVEGFHASVAYRAQALVEMFKACPDVTVQTDPVQTTAVWQGISEAAPFHNEAGDVWKISCVPSDATRLAQAAGGRILFDWAGGLIWALTTEGHDLRLDLGSFDGHATRIRAGKTTAADAPTFAPEHPLIERLSAGLREKFDPRGILNPGLMG